MKNAHRCQSC